MVRYVDDIVYGFQYRSDAQRFRHVLEVRLKKFGLTFHPEKTRFLEFDRFADPWPKDRYSVRERQLSFQTWGYS